MRSFTSLGLITCSLRRGERGQALAYEAIALALVIFAIMGAVSLVGRLT